MPGASHTHLHTHTIHELATFATLNWYGALSCISIRRQRLDYYEAFFIEPGHASSLIVLTKIKNRNHHAIIWRMFYICIQNLAETKIFRILFSTQRSRNSALCQFLKTLNTFQIIYYYYDWLYYIMSLYLLYGWFWHHWVQGWNNTT